ncbi:MAG: DsbE family thiol:disulfide interchange protein [Pseudomonadota bacterium]
MAKVSPLMIAPLVTGALLVFLVAGLFRNNPDALPSALAGKPAPETQFTPLASKPEFRPEVLKEPGPKLVNFWASWCAPCRAEHPNLTAIAEEGIPVYGVNYKDQTEKALDFLNELGDPFAALAKDSSGRPSIDWGVIAVPETFVINSEGKIVLRFAGPITERVMDSEIRPAIERAKN